MFNAKRNLPRWYIKHKQSDNLKYKYFPFFSTNIPNIINCLDNYIVEYRGAIVVNVCFRRLICKRGFLCDRIVNSFQNFIGKCEQHFANKSRKEREWTRCGIFGAWRYFSGEIPVYGLRRNCVIERSKGEKEGNELIEKSSYLDDTFVYLFVCWALYVMPGKCSILIVRRFPACTFITLTPNRDFTNPIGLLSRDQLERYALGKMHRLYFNVVIMASRKKNNVSRGLIQETGMVLSTKLDSRKFDKVKMKWLQALHLRI